VKDLISFGSENGRLTERVERERERERESEEKSKVKEKNSVSLFRKITFASGASIVRRLVELLAAAFEIFPATIFGTKSSQNGRKEGRK
jgi:hypothetical protein